MDVLAKLKDMVHNSRRIVFFGGAGVSTESGIPDFRSVDGLYHQSYAYPPETILSHSFFMKNTKEFYRFYKDKMIYLKAMPNPAHMALANWEKKAKLSAIITQNIDGLHQAAGSRNVVELHGSIHRNHCMRCKKPYSLEDILKSDGIPTCTCGGTIKPDVVLYEEPLDQLVMEKTVHEIADADMLLIGGTSLSVYPAAGFVEAFTGRYLAIINKTPTPFDEKADAALYVPIGEALQKIMV